MATAERLVAREVAGEALAAANDTGAHCIGTGQTGHALVRVRIEGGEKAVRKACELLESDFSAVNEGAHAAAQAPADDGDGAGAEPEEVPIDSLTDEQLAEVASDAGLSTAGPRADLIARIEARQERMRALDGMKLKEVQAEAKGLGLSAGGKRAEIVERILAAETAGTESGA